MKINVFWGYTDQLTKNIFYFSYLIWMAFELTPHDFGRLSLLLSTLMVANGLVRFGIDNVVIKALVLKNNPSLCYSLCLIRMMASVLLLFVLYQLMLFMDLNEDLLQVLPVILIFNIFKSHEVIELWYKAKVKIKTIAVLRALAYGTLIVLSLINYFFYQSNIEVYYVLLFSEPIIFFALIFSKFVYDNKVSINYRARYIYLIYRRSLPIMLSFMVYLLYLKTDQYMLFYFGFDDELGVFSLSSKILESLSFVVTGIVLTYYPKMISLYKQKKLEEAYMVYYRSTMIFMLMGYSIVLLYYFILPFFNDLLLTYKPEYKSLGSILLIQLISLPIIFNAGFRSSYATLINRNTIILISSLTALFINVVLNFVFIPEYGMYGAAVTTIVTQLISLFLMNFLFKDMRIVAIIECFAYLLIPVPVFKKYYNKYL